MPFCFALIIASTFFAILSADAQQELGTLSVVVKDEAGKPVTGATVQCVNWNDYFPRTEPLTPREQATSDAEGRAVFEGVTLGQAFVRVISGDLGGWFRVQDRGPDVPLVIGVGHSTQIVIRDESGKPIQDVLASADGCIPFGKTDKDGLVTIRNHGIGYTPQLFFSKKGYAWEAVHLPFNPEKVIVTLKQGVQVEGVVLDPEGKPVPDAEIMWNRQRMLYSDSKGNFTFPEVAIGSKATLDVNAWKAQPPLIGGANITVSAPPIEKVAIILRPAPQSPEQRGGLTLRGRVLHVETGKPVMSSILLEHSPQFEWPDKAATTGEDGRFTIEHVEGGRVWICAAPGDPTLYTVGGLIEVDTSKAASEEVAIQIDDGCALRGRVLTDEGNPVPSVQVMFQPMGPYYRMIATNPEGRFVIPNLDGVGITYTLTVTDQLQRQATLEIGPMAKGEIRSDLELRMPKVIEPAKLRGSVVDADGHPVANVNLYFHYSSGGPEPSMLMATSDDRGAFSIPIPHSGTVKTSAHKVIQTNPSQHDSVDCPVLEGGSFDLTEGADQAVRIVVKPEVMRLFACKVVDEDGQPVKAQVYLLHGEYGSDSVPPDSNGLYLTKNLPKEAYILEVTSPQYQARVMFPGADFQEDGTEVTIALKKGPFPIGTSIWEAVTGRPATQESVASTPLAEVIRKREHRYFRTALPPRVPALAPDGRSIVSAPPPTDYSRMMRIVDAKGNPITRILVEPCWEVGLEKVALLPPKPGAQQPQTASDGVYAISPNNSPSCVVSAPGLARVLVDFRYTTTNGPRTIVLEESATVELLVNGPDGRPAAGVPVYLPESAWEGTANETYTLLAKTGAEGQATFADIAPGAYSFAVGVFQKNMQVVSAALQPKEHRKLTVNLEESQGSRNPLVLLQQWREARRPQPRYPSETDEAWVTEIRALPRTVQEALAKAVRESLPILLRDSANGRNQSNESALLLGLAAATGNRAVAKDLKETFEKLPDDPMGNWALSNGLASRLAAAIADIESDDSAAFFERCAGEAKLPPTTRMAALFALGRVHSEKSAAAFARLRDTACGKPGAPQRRESYTHVQRMLEAAVMTLFVIPGVAEGSQTLQANADTGAYAQVSEDYRTGTLWMNNVEFQFHRVGAEWLVSSARQGPVP